MKKGIGLVLILFLLTSCAVEKPNLSPLSNNFSSFSNVNSITGNYYQSLEKVNYAAELTNILSEFPVFKNSKLNAEIYKLKLSITDYIYSVKQENVLEKSNAYKKYRDAFKNIQTIKLQLPKDQLELLNRFLAKVKTNMSLIDSINSTETK